MYARPICCSTAGTLPSSPSLLLLLALRTCGCVKWCSVALGSSPAASMLSRMAWYLQVAAVPAAAASVLDAAERMKSYGGNFVVVPASAKCQQDACPQPQAAGLQGDSCDSLPNTVLHNHLMAIYNTRTLIALTLFTCVLHMHCCTIVLHHSFRPTP